MREHQIAPFEELFSERYDQVIPLPPELASIYGHLSFPVPGEKPYVIANFVSTIDGVVTLNVPGHNASGEISGSNRLDHILMGILRSIADAIIVGAGTLREAIKHKWTAAHIYPPFADAYQLLRNNLGKSEAPLNVFVTKLGNVNFDLHAFQSIDIPILIITTKQGYNRILSQSIPPSVQIVAVDSNTTLSAQDILKAVTRVRACDLILTEGGPQLFGDFLSEKCLHELFLTLAPQIAGRDQQIARGGIVAGKIFAPEHPLWGKLISVKRGGSHLFLRYAFESAENQVHVHK
jgi:riboflavin biosynthesis pyrimidine reductase